MNIFGIIQILAKNAMGMPYWRRTAPIVVPLASQSTWNTLLKFGNANIGCVVTLFFNSSNEFSATVVH